MKITHVLTATNYSKKYIKFIPMFIIFWKHYYPGIIPVIIYVGTLSEYINFPKEWRCFMILFERTTDLHSALIAQTIRLLYPCILPEDAITVITDIDMVPGNSNYFDNNLINQVSEKSFLQFRQRNIDDQIPICYNAAKTNIWKEIFDIYSLNDVNLWLSNTDFSTYNGLYDGLHGGKGWFSDQIILSKYLEKWKGNKTCLSDDITHFSRLDWFHYQYDISLFKKLIDELQPSDAHLYACECVWTIDQINQINKMFI